MGFLDDVIDKVGEPYSGGKGFEWGTHEVVIGSIEAKDKKTKNDPAAKVIEVEVFDEQDNDKTATCTLYFHTEGGAKMSVTKILGILVHNVGEEKKERVRELGKKLFSSVNDESEARDVAEKLMNEKLVGKKAYLVAEPNGDYKTTNYGDLWHYEAKPEGDAPKKESVTPVEEVDPADVPEFDDL